MDMAKEYRRISRERFLNSRKMETQIFPNKKHPRKRIKKIDYIEELDSSQDEELKFFWESKNS